MQLSELYEKIDARYPKKLSDDYIAAYGGHDNSGILIDCAGPVTGAVFSLDFSMAAIEEAEKAGYNLLVTHHPAIFFPVSSLRQGDALGARLLRAARGGIGVISMHLNMDCAAGGIDESLAEAAGAKETQIVERLQGGGYGRVFQVPAKTLSAFASSLQEKLGAKRAFVYGDENRTVETAASFCGAGVDAGAIAAAKRCGAQVIVSADIKHNFICDALESGIAVVQLTHYASENYGFWKIYQTLRDELGVPSAYHTDACML